ncbi:probable G-protein coupled receptor B0563.6, partial [Musca vetustissima]|uniref:probable G-protein coupled receptor B0563.6 n=1 Tax=Musca vetustissima TaxID=27455 RepID=UPI002AB7F26C
QFLFGRNNNTNGNIPYVYFYTVILAFSQVNNLLIISKDNIQIICPKTQLQTTFDKPFDVAYHRHQPITFCTLYTTFIYNTLSCLFLLAYSTAALLAIVFAIPFGIRMLVHKDRGQWEEFGPAFYTAHLELFLGNGCLGVGVMMLLVLTIERYVSVCHPSFTRPVMGPPGLIVFLTTLITFIIYLPSVFRGELIKCVLQTDGSYVYFRRDNNAFMTTIFYNVYKVMLEVIFKLIPTVLIAGLNLRIMMVYRQTCEKRRKMTSSRASYIKDAEEKRLFLLLGSTSILFLVCVSPMAILHMTIASDVLPSFSFQVFRALANLMELTNYSITFYIYCLFSEDFRNTLIRTIKWPWIRTQLCHQVDEVSAKQTPLTNFDKLTLRNHHITTTSGVCTGIGRSSSI